MHILIHPVYFGSIAQFAAISKADEITFEKQDNFQKQTLRNRTYIATPEGSLLLNIPIKHSSKGKRGERKKVHQKYKDVRIENDFPWQREHWKSIQISYRSSPFFEFFEDDFAPLYQKKYQFLMDFNIETFEVLKEALGIDLNINFTDTYEVDTKDKVNYRNLVSAKSSVTFNNDPYTQVLEKYHSFLPNLSVIDLLFNEGTNALSYLENQKL